MTPNTIGQRTRDVTIASATGPRTLTVKRLPWKAAKAFYAHLAQQVAGFLVGKGPVSVFEILPRLVLDSAGLVEELLAGATDLSTDELQALDYGDVLALANAALEVNLDDEIKNSCAGVVAKVKRFELFPKPPSGPESTPTSSTPAIPPTTSTAAP